jgi:DNA-binding response OmpR family regulator
MTKPAPMNMNPAAKTKPPPRILVVDDEPWIRLLSAEVLLHSGYQVDEAEDGVAAWEALQLNRYDLLVTDNNMCRLTGIGLIKKLHAARLALPVILMSGAMPTEELNRHPWLQIEAALLKPFTTDELLANVERVLRATDRVRGQIAPPPTGQASCQPAVRGYEDSYAATPGQPFVEHAAIGNHRPAWMANQRRSNANG